MKVVAIHFFKILFIVSLFVFTDNATMQPYPTGYITPPLSLTNCIRVELANTNENTINNYQLVPEHADEIMKIVKNQKFSRIEKLNILLALNIGAQLTLNNTETTNKLQKREFDRGIAYFTYALNLEKNRNFITEEMIGIAAIQRMN